MEIYIFLSGISTFQSIGFKHGSFDHRIPYLSQFSFVIKFLHSLESFLQEPKFLFFILQFFNGT